MKIEDALFIMEFFKWCSILNFIAIIFFATLYVILSDSIYNIHKKLGFYNGSKEDHKCLIFKSFGTWKIIAIVFNIMPYFAIRIIFG